MRCKRERCDATELRWRGFVSGKVNGKRGEGRETGFRRQTDTQRERECGQKVLLLAAAENVSQDLKGRPALMSKY